MTTKSDEKMQMRSRDLRCSECARLGRINVLEATIVDSLNECSFEVHTAN